MEFDKTICSIRTLTKAKTQKTYADKKWSHYTVFEIGSDVLLNTRNVKLKRGREWATA